MINYDFKTIIFVLLKKWYIVLGMMLILGAASIPMARASYQRATDNYNELAANATNPALYNVTANYEVNEEFEDGMYIYMACLKDASLMQTVCKAYNVNVQWNEVCKLVEYSYNENNHTFQVLIRKAQAGEADILINAITVYLVDYLEENNFGKIELNEEGFWKSECADEGKIVAELVKAPGTMKSQSRILVTAVVFGAVLGCMIVMIFDYISKSKKMVEEKK